MPGTTRYSATFDRTCEEEAKPSSPPNARRSRSQSWQANSGHDGRQYTPFASRSPAPRSSSTDNSPVKGTEFIPTRTAKTSVKAHNNPFQFVKVGTCPLYKKAEEQLKKAKEVKKPDVLKEEEEEWQTNLDSWKSRRRKMSEDIFRRQEDLKLLELEEQIAQVSQKKTKTFSEMVESRATRGRALSLCLLTSPLEFQTWEFENKSHKNGSCSYTDESEENSTVNSEDEGVSVKGRHGETSHNVNETNHRTNGDAHIEQNGNCNKLSNNVQIKPKENPYIDSGLESISSSHRADSGSDFSQDSNSSIDCDSPRTGVNVLEEFSSKSQKSEGHEIIINLRLEEKGQDFGFTFLGGKDEGQVIIASILEGTKAESSNVQLGDRVITIDSCDVSSKKHIEIAALIQRGREKGQINMLLWRHTKSINETNGCNGDAKHVKVTTDENRNAKSYEKSIESENEMYVDDFEDLKRQSELLANKKSETSSINAQAQLNGNKPPNKDSISLKISSENSTAPILKTNAPKSAVEEPGKKEERAEINNENQKKTIIKVKRVRRKGVYALNVDSNQISQDENSSNSLFPLSPVTELPSPADETKTVASTLSSNNTLPVSNSQNGMSDERKQNGAEVKPNSPIIKVNNTITSISTKTENSKSLIINMDLKNIENGIELNTKNTIEAVDVPPLISKNKESQEEKPMLQSTPKIKVKVNKLKKGTASENTSKCFERTKEDSSSSPSVGVVSKALIQENSSTKSKPSHTLENKQSTVKNDIENLTISKTMDKNGLPKNISALPTTETLTVPTKTPASDSITSNCNGIHSPKADIVNVDTPLTIKPLKMSASEDNKPKKNIQKKIIAKPKASNTAEKNSSGTPSEATLNEIYSSKDQTLSSAMKKQEHTDSKNETPVSPLKEENGVSLNVIADVSQETKPSPVQDETPVPCPSSNKVKDLALKFGEKKTVISESPLPASNAKQIKSPTKEKSKPLVISRKEGIKIKENCIEQNLTSCPATCTSVSNALDSFKTTTLPIQNKQVQTPVKDESTIASSKMQMEKKTISSISNTSDTPVKANIKENKLKKDLKPFILTSESKTDVHTVIKENSVQPIPPVSAQTMKNITKSSSSTPDTSTKNTNNESKIKIETLTVNTEKQPKLTPKNEIVAASSKRGNSDDQVPIGNKQASNKCLVSSVSSGSVSPSSNNLIKGVQLRKEKKTASLAQDEQTKTVTKSETKVSPLNRVINFCKSYK